MKYNFCTLFDSAYLSRALVMYESLKASDIDFYIYIFAFDDLCYEILKSISLENANIISLEMFENKDLLAVKESRSRAEYFWTCTSSIIEYVLTNFRVPSCTYIDADLFFYRSPRVLLEELSGAKSILITEHRYSFLARHYEQKRAGRFCVQFITFLNTYDSKAVLSEWKTKCIDWCFDRYEDGKFGDQKYLDEWPGKCKNIQIMRHPGGGVAPWNIGLYRLLKDHNSLYVIERNTGRKYDLIFFHFHFVRFMENKDIDLGWNHIDKSVRELIYYPYVRLISETEKILSELNKEYKPAYYLRKPKNLKEKIKSFIKNNLGYNILKSPII